MRWLFRIIFLIIVITGAMLFGIKNPQLVDVNVFDIVQLSQVKLAYVVIGSFALGLILGWLLLLVSKTFAAARLGSAKRQLKRAEAKVVDLETKLEDNATKAAEKVA